MIEHYYKHLKWDTEFFGYNVAEIIKHDISPQELALVLDSLKANKYRLVYLPLQIQHAQIQSDYTIHPVSSKITLECDLELFPHSNEMLHKINSGRQEDQNRIISIALQSAHYSRFYTDPQIPNVQAENLFSLWIKKAFSQSEKDTVLTINDTNNTIVGICSVSLNNTTACTELFAVDFEYRGKGYGKTLLLGSLSWLKSNGATRCTVNTQGHNSAALSLYESCGFIKKNELFYSHIWL